jgi:hypothetical protein
VSVAVSNPTLLDVHLLLKKRIPFAFDHLIICSRVDERRLQKKKKAAKKKIQIATTHQTQNQHQLTKYSNK